MTEPLPLRRQDTKSYRHLQQAQYFEEALQSGNYPVVDKDAAEDILENYRLVRGRHHPRVAVIEERVRDGHPISTHIAITKLRVELAKLIENAHSQLTPHERVLVPVKREES